MTRLFALLLLVSTAVFAQPAVTRGGALKKRAYQTYSALTLYVDPTGSDSNACTASGTAACLTFAGALSKLPRFIRHNVTINMAAGTYAEPAVSGFNIAQGVTFSIVGTESAFTPATGTNSGTTTGTGTVTQTAHSALVDSAQTWTVNNLKYAFVRFDSGSLSGQTYPIVSNTATTLTIPTSAVIASGVTYSIVTMGSTFTGTGSFAWSDLSGTGTLDFVRVRMSKTNNTAMWGPTSAGFQGTNVRCTSCDLTSNNNTVQVNSGILSLLRSQVGTSSSTTGAFAVSVFGTAAIVSMSTNFLYSTGTHGVLRFSALRPLSANPLLGVIEGSGTSGTPLARVNNTSFSSFDIECTGGSSVGLSVGSLWNGTASQATVSNVNVFGLSVVGCTTAVQVTGGELLFSTTNPTFTTATTGVSVSRAGRVDFFGVTPTFTTVTNEIQLDGENFTFATLTGASPAVLSNSYGSTIVR